MFTVTGRLNGSVYTAVVGDPATHPDALGIVTGSPLILNVLRANEGRSHAATPTGPFANLDVADQRSVLIALMDLTRVVRIDGDAPQVLGEDDVPADAVH